LSANVDFNWMAFAAAVSERMPGGCQIVETTITAAGEAARLVLVV
jgi:hypothetical protein